MAIDVIAPTRSSSGTEETTPDSEMRAVDRQPISYQSVNLSIRGAEAVSRLGRVAIDS